MQGRFSETSVAEERHHWSTVNASAARPCRFLPGAARRQAAALRAPFGARANHPATDPAPLPPPPLRRRLHSAGSPRLEQPTKDRLSYAVLSWCHAIITHPNLPECAGCGYCCHLVVELREDDRVPEEFVVEHDGARCMDQHGDGACVALDPVTRLCTIYADRPQTCRDFTRGEPLCIRTLVKRGIIPAAEGPAPPPR